MSTLINRSHGRSDERRRDAKERERYETSLKFQPLRRPRTLTCHFGRNFPSELISKPVPTSDSLRPASSAMIIPRVLRR